MPTLMRDFHCGACGKTTERFIDTEATCIHCDCGEMATRIIGMPRVSLDGSDPDFPGAYSKWATVREENARIKSKRSYAE